MINKNLRFTQKSNPPLVAPAGSPHDSARTTPAGSFNSEYPLSQNEIVMDCAKMWNWMKPSYKKSALIIVGMDAALKCGQPVSFPNANTYMNTNWNDIPSEWQEKLKRFFVQ